MNITPQQAQQQLQDLLNTANQLGKTVDNLWVSDPLAYADNILRTFIKWDDELKIINNDLYGLKSILEANLNELTNGNVQLIKARKNTRDLISVTQQLNNDQAGILDLNKQQVEKLIQKTKIANEELKISSLSMDLTQDQRDVALDNLKLGEQVLEQAKQRLELENDITKSLGLGVGAVHGLQKLMKGLGFEKMSEQLGLDDAIAKTREYAKEQIIARNNGTGSEFGSSNIINNFKSLNVLVKNLGSNLLKALGPLALIAGIVDAMLNLDKMSGNIAKQFGISYTQARGINNEINAIAYNTGNVFVDAQKLNESFLSLSASLGTNTMLSGELLINFTELTQQAGYSVEAVTTLSKLSLITSKSSKDITASYLGQAKLLNIKNGLAINEKALLNDINNVSKSTLLIYSQNPKELAKAAYEAKKIGLELKQVESIASSFLNIESSIASEFEAEIMTGRQLYLERARYYALTNDLASLSIELNKQGISSVKYGEMNFLQQESYAKALGMSKDEMSNMLMEQEAIRAVNAKDIDDLKEKLKLAQARGEEEKFLNEIGNKTLADQLKSTTAQERFQATLSKLQDIFTQIAEPLMPILDIFAEIFTILGPIASLVSKVLAPPLKLINLIVTAISDTLKGIVGLFYGKSFDFSSTKSATKGLGESLLFDPLSMKKTQDGKINSEGVLTVSGPKGSVQLDSEDTFVGNKNGITAGTNLFEKQKIENNTINNQNNNQKTETRIINNTTSSTDNISSITISLNNKMDIMINKLDNIVNAVNKGMVVNLDGNRVSQELLTPLAINNRNI